MGKALDHQGHDVPIFSFDRHWSFSPSCHPSAQTLCFSHCSVNFGKHPSVILVNTFGAKKYFPKQNHSVLAPTWTSTSAPYILAYSASFSIMCLVWHITHPDTGVCCVSSSILEAAGQVAAVLSRYQWTADHILPPPGAPIGSSLRNSHSVSSCEQEPIHLTKTLCRCVSLCV